MGPVVRIGECYQQIPSQMEAISGWTNGLDPTKKTILPKSSKRYLSISPPKVCTRCPSPLQRWNPLGTPASGSSNFQLSLPQHSEEEKIVRKHPISSAVVLWNEMGMWSELVSGKTAYYATFVGNQHRAVEKFKTACHHILSCFAHYIWQSHDPMNSLSANYIWQTLLNSLTR